MNLKQYRLNSCRVSINRTSTPSLKIDGIIWCAQCTIYCWFLPNLWKSPNLARELGWRVEMGCRISRSFAHFGFNLIKSRMLRKSRVRLLLSPRYGDITQWQQCLIRTHFCPFNHARQHISLPCVFWQSFRAKLDEFFFPWSSSYPNFSSFCRLD